MRKDHFQRLASEYESRAAQHRESFPEMPTPTGDDCWTYIRHRLKFWSEGIEVYTQHSYAKMAFDSTNIQTRKSPLTKLFTA